MAIYTYFENGKRNPPPLSGNITCAAFDKGWFWYIPLSDTLTSVGADIGKEYADQLKKKDYSVVFAELIDQCPLIKDFLSPAKRVAEGIYAPVRIIRKDWSYTTARFWKPGLVLVGDAACFIDPVFSSGVHLNRLFGHARRSIDQHVSQGNHRRAALFR
jgi:FAD-dependent halogenase